MRFEKNLRAGAALLPLLLVVLVWAGCGEDAMTPNAPIYTADNPPPILTGAGSAGVMSTAASGDWYELAAEVVNPDDQFKAVGGGRYELVFAQGAVSEPTKITIREHDERVLDVQFGPHGTHFGNTVRLQVDFSGTNADPNSKSYDGSVPAFFWFNEKTGVWEKMRGEVKGLTYVVKLEHFSRYALGGIPPGDGTADW